MSRPYIPREEIKRLGAELSAQREAMAEQLKHRKEDADKIFNLDGLVDMLNHEKEVLQAELETQKNINKNQSKNMGNWEKEIADLVSKNDKLHEWNKDSLARRFELKAENKKMRGYLKEIRKLRASNHPPRDWYRILEAQVGIADLALKVDDKGW